MASVDRHPVVSLAPSKKHPRDDDPPKHASEPLPKRPCPDLSPTDRTASHLGFLEELYEFENSLDGTALESSTQEELVAEMMKSLEKVIGPFDVTPLPELSVSGDSSESLRPWQSERSEAEDVPATVPNSSSDFGFLYGQLLDESDGIHCNETHVQIRDLLEASDDELGIPPCQRTSVEKLSQSTCDDWSSAQARCSGFETSSNVLPGAAVVNSHVPGGWLDGNFDQLDDSFADFSKDHGDLVSLDSVF